MAKIKTAVLFSGGKDSALAIAYALKFSNVKCLISLQSENKESYMFHTPNIGWVKKQAECIGLPLIVQKTMGEKEKELIDLEEAIKKAKEDYAVEGIVTGAIESVYQSSRIQEICSKLDIECFNPLWQRDQIEILQELVDKKFEVIVCGIFAYGLDNFLGKKIDADFIEKIKKVQEKLKINPAGEGGEFESFVLDAPFFSKKLKIKESHVVSDKQGAKVLVLDKLEEVKK